MVKVIKSIFIIIVISAVAGYGTYSYFSDTETSTGNTFTAGAIDLQIDSQCSYNGNTSTECGSWELKDLIPTSDKFFNFADIKPGDFGENTVSLHINNNDAWVCLTIDNLQNNENECNEAETTAGDTTCGSAPDQGELAQELYFTAWADDGDNVWEDGEPLLFSNKFGPASDILNGKTYAIADSTTGNPITGDQTQNIGIQWCFGTMTVNEGTHEISCDGTATGNEAQTDSLSADVKFYVEQARNNENFKCLEISGNGNGACVAEDEVCSDGIDNDCDGYVDCGDSDCANEQICEEEMDGYKTAKLENKTISNPSWPVIVDGTFGNLNYKESGPTFNYSFTAQGMTPNEHYNLIYYPDPWGDPKTIVLIGGAITANASGDIDTGNQSVELNMDLPNSAPGFDINYPAGAKIWLALSNSLTGNQLKWQNGSKFLFETQFINYDDTDVTSNKTTLTDLGASSQYGYYHDYSGANASFTYDTPASSQLSGTFTATSLKPYATYQLKFEGKPTCKFGASGDDTLNEYIGYKGRWWDNTTNANATDANYVANHAAHCITGYLVWGYVTADASGNVTKDVTTDSSYHVLWCSGGTCGQSNNNQLVFLDPAHPALNLCTSGNVNGQIERGSCGEMTFASGTYKLGMILNEESFHQGPGTWTAVMGGNVDFKIN